MTIYEFIGRKEDCHKLTSQKMNATTLVNALSLLEMVGDRGVEIRMHQKRFCEFVCNAFSENVENSVYERSVRTMKFMNADMTVDNSLDESIVEVRGKKSDGMSLVKIFIGNC